MVGGGEGCPRAITDNFKMIASSTKLNCPTRNRVSHGETANDASESNEENF